MATWYGGWTSLLRSPKHPPNQTETGIFSTLNCSWQHLKKLTRWFQLRCSDVLRLPASQPSTQSLETSSERCPFRQRGCAHPGSFLSCQLSKHQCPWDRPAWSGQLGIAVLRRCGWKPKEAWYEPPQPGKSMKEWHGPINHTKSTTVCPTVTGRKWEMKSNQLLYNSYSYYRTNQSQFSSPCRHCRLTTLIWLKLPHLI